MSGTFKHQQRAENSGQAGPEVADLPHGGDDRLLATLGAAARWAVRTCPADPGTGGEQQQVLLAAAHADFNAVGVRTEQVLRQEGVWIPARRV